MVVMPAQVEGTSKTEKFPSRISILLGAWRQGGIFLTGKLLQEKPRHLVTQEYKLLAME